MSAPGIKITDVSLVTSLGAWADARKRRGKDYEDTLRKVMREWVHLAFDYVSKKHPASKEKIRNYLMGVTMKYASRKSSVIGRKRSKAKMEMQGTLAAAIIWKLDWKGARSAKNSTAFYQKAKAFLRAREFSSGLHKAGFFATFDLVHGRPAGSSGPRYKKFPLGKVEQKQTGDWAEIVSSNFASAKNGLGITGLAGEAFDATLAPTIAKFRAYAIEEELKNATKHGVPLVFA